MSEKRFVILGDTLPVDYIGDSPPVTPQQIFGTCEKCPTPVECYRNHCCKLVHNSKT